LINRVANLKNIIVSFPSEIDNEFEKIHQLLMDDTIDFFHLRKPDFDYFQFKEFIKLIDVDLHYKIVIHSHYSLIEEFDLAGINLNRKALSQLAYADEVDKCFIQPLVLNNTRIEVNRIIPNMVTFSAHSFAEIKNLNFDTDYVFLSPIFDSISKDEYLSKFGLNDLDKELKTCNTNVVALGGVTLDHKEVLKETGFYGMARLGDFWN